MKCFASREHVQSQKTCKSSSERCKGKRTDQIRNSLDLKGHAGASSRQASKRKMSPSTNQTSAKEKPAAVR